MTEIVEHPEVLLYTRIRKSPFFYASRRHGVRMYSFYNHMYHPRHYGDPVEEYWQLLNGVTLWDVGASSSPLPTAGSSTIRSCCAWTRTTSGSRWPIATYSCGRWASPTSRGST